eukprot:gene20362-24430_t
MGSYHYSKVYVADEQRLSGLLMLIHNCIVSSEARRRKLVVDSRGIDLLKAVLASMDGNNEDESEVHDQIFHWTYLIFKSLIDGDYFPELYRSFGDDNYTKTTTKLKDIKTHPMFKDVFGDEGQPRIEEDEEEQQKDDHMEGRSNEHQVRLLNLLDAFVTGEKNIKEYIEEDAIMDTRCCLFLLEELSVLYNLDFARKSASPDSTVTRLNEFDFDAIYFIIKIFGNITCYSDEMLDIVLKNRTTHPTKDDINTILRKKGLIGTLHGNHEIETKDQVEGNGQDKGFKKEIIRILGNLAFKNKENQDEIRELGGINLILNHCKIDLNNLLNLFCEAHGSAEQLD